LTAAWVFALLLVGAMAIFLLDRAGPDRHPFGGVGIAVVGSSLSRYAIPAEGRPGMLLGDARSHRRIGPSMATEAEILDLIEAALDDRTEVILIEINPLIRDFAKGGQVESCDGLQSVVRSNAWRERLKVAYSFRRWLGVSTSYREGNGESDDIDQQQVIDPLAMQEMYPLKLHFPSCRERLDRLIARAKRQRTEAVFFLAPRSEAALSFMPPKQNTEMETLARTLARQLDVPIFAPPGPWSNAFYKDNSHFNLQGRAHFDAELRQWWARRG
jgi:hypothetical protein